MRAARRCRPRSLALRRPRWWCSAILVGLLLLPGGTAFHPAATPTDRSRVSPAVAAAPPRGTTPTLTSSTPADWSTYGSDPQRTGDNPGERVLSPLNAASLQVAWTTELNATVLGSLIVVNDTLYVGGFNGFLMALNATTGARLNASSSHPWLTPFLGNTSYSRCGTGANLALSKRSGIIATPTLSGGRLYESGGNTSFYTLSLSGQILQRVDIANNSSSPWWYDYNWASPLIYHGSAYLGTAAQCEYNDGDANSADWKYIQGQLIEVNLTRGVVTHVYNVTKGASTADTGGSIWSTPSVDPSTNTVWVTTGNENLSTEIPANGELPRSTVALNATTLAVEGSCQVGYVGADADFGAGPTLFTVRPGATYVGAINKDGTFFAYNATDPGRGNCGSMGSGNLPLVWSHSFCAGTTPGTISPAAFDGQFLYIASDGCGNDSGWVDQLYPSNGTIRWSHSLYSPSAEAHAGVTVADGLVVVAANTISGGSVGPGELQVLNASSGALLYQHAFVAESNAWPVVADGTIFVTSGNVSELQPGWVTAFRAPLAAVIQVSDASCSGMPVTNCTAVGSFIGLSQVPSGGAPPTSCQWQFGDGTAGSGCSVSHVYSAVGSYPVRLDVTDAVGAQASAVVNVTVVLIPPPGTSDPPARSGEVLAYDPAANETVLFGGRCTEGACSGQLLNDTWAFSGSGWTNLTPQLEPAPPPLADAAYCFDPVLGGLVVFGGEILNGSGPDAFVPWTWEFSGGGWTNLSGALTGSPPALAGASAAYDNSSGTVLLFGGLRGADASAGTVTNASWTLTGETWASLSTPAAPAARAFGGLAEDGPDHALILFGGADANGTALNDTWTYHGGAWNHLRTSPTPPAGSSEALVTGGATGPVLLWDGATAGATWEFSGGTWSGTVLVPQPPPGPVAGAWIDFARGVLLLDGNATWGFGDSAWGALPPSASVVLQPAEAEVASPSNATAVVVGGMAPYSYAWTLAGRSLAATAGTVSLNVATPGNVLVGVHVTDALGESVSAQSILTVASGLAPTFVQSPTVADVGLPVEFAGGSVGGVAPVALSWTFGDGSAATSGPIADHTFGGSGTYRVNLTATDAAGGRAVANATIVVAPALSLAPISPFAPADVDRAVVVGSAVAGGTGAESIEATFGDGSSEELPMVGAAGGAFTVDHAYAAAGRYLVNLTARDSLGAAVTTSRTVAVNGSLEPPRLQVPGALVTGASGTFATSAAGGSPPYSFTWTFGDGNRAAGASVAHAYVVAGRYVVAVVVTDAAGANVTGSASVSVATSPASSPVGWVEVGIGAAAVGAGLVAIMWYRARHHRPGQRAR